MAEALASSPAQGMEIGLDPDLAGALRLHRLGRAAEAIRLYLRRLAACPDDVDASHLCGVALRQRHHSREAAAFQQQALALKPEFPDAHLNLGNTLRDLGDMAGARDAYVRAIRLDPDFLLAWVALAAVLVLMGQPEQALFLYRQVVAREPHHARWHYELGITLERAGNLVEAEQCMGRATRIDPGHGTALGQRFHLRQHLCLWDDWDTLHDQVVASIYQGGNAAPFLVLALDAGADLQQIAARTLARKRLEPKAASCFPLWQPRQRPAGSPLRIGYLSADFQQHATSALMAEVFECHDRRRNLIYTYSYGNDDKSWLRQRIRKASDVFRDVQPASHLDIARQIASDGIDILVDLKGYTTDARIDILAYRAAPVQMHWLGYPGTLGTSLVDYYLADSFTACGSVRAHFDETLVVMPHCYQPNDRRRQIADTGRSRADDGLPEEAFVFCAFNNTYKMTPALFRIWMGFLREFPHAVLWTLAYNPYAAEALGREAAACGVAPERIITSPLLPLDRHLARYQRADLALDTYPVTGHTTTSDALWAGCPVVTRAGETFASRVAGSLLHAAGLGELVTHSFAEYTALVRHLVRAPQALADIRLRLQQQRNASPLFDTPRFVRELEGAYQNLWQHHNRKQAEARHRMTAGGQA